MPEFSSSKIIKYHFRLDNNKGESGIGYYMIIGRDLAVQLVLMDNFKSQLLQWDGATVPMKEQSGLLGKPYLSQNKMLQVVMQTAEPASVKEVTDRLVKILDSTYVNSDLKQVVDNTTHLNAAERTQLIRILKYFEDLFDGTLGDWYTDPVDLELNPGSKPFNSKYYPVPRINKEAFCKELKLLV